MRKLLVASAATLFLGVSLSTQAQDEPLAIMIPGGGTYSYPTSIESDEAQAFFDQGLRMAWSFYFPEAIASYLSLIHI